MGTPPRPSDNGEVFTARRKDALDGDPDTLYIELSADKGSKIIDWDQVAKANPSYPHRTGKTAVLRMQKLLGSDEGFYREGYGIWDDDSAGAVFPPGVWNGQGRDGRKLDRPVLAVDMRSGLKQSISFGVAGGVEDGSQVTLAKYESGFGAQWPEDFACELTVKLLADRGLDTVVVDGYAENEALIVKLIDAGVNVVKLNQADMANAAVAFTSALINKSLWHTKDPLLDAAVVGAAKKTYRDTLYTWSHLKSVSDITPLRSVNAAWWYYTSMASDYDVLDSFF